MMWEDGLSPELLVWRPSYVLFAAGECWTQPSSGLNPLVEVIAKVAPIALTGSRILHAVHCCCCMWSACGRNGTHASITCCHSNGVCVLCVRLIGSHQWYCRRRFIPFTACDTAGQLGFVFNDFIEHSYRLEGAAATSGSGDQPVSAQQQQAPASVVKQAVYAPLEQALAVPWSRLPRRLPPLFPAMQGTCT